MEARTKLLFHSNAPFSPTGYGQQCGLLTPHLAQHYDLRISSFYGLDGSSLTLNGVHIYPGLGGEFGNESLPAHAKNFFGDPRGGIVITLMDVWVLDPAMAAGLNMGCWVPVDHEPAPPAVVNFFMKSGAVPITMSRFGERMLGRLDPLYVPHAVDVSVFKPYDKQAVREKFEIPPGTFLVGMVAANKGRSPSRKGFSEALQAFRILRAEHENAMLYLHTMPEPGHAQGEDIMRLIEALELPEESVRFANPYKVMYDPLPPRAMAMIYSSFDVLLNPAMGEGFGLGPLEAGACGVPSVVTNFSAMPEVAGPAGWKVGCRPFWTGQNSFQATPDVPEIAQALKDCYVLKPRERELLSIKAREHAMGYALPKVLEEYFLPALKIVEQRFADRNPVTISPRLRAAA